MIESDRVKLVRLLDRGGKDARGLARALEVSVPTIMRWLRQLREEGVRVVALRRRNRWSYELAPDAGAARPPPRVRGLPAFPPRPATAHKGSVGRVLIMAGSEGMAGAAVLASRAAYRAGAGLVYLATPRAVLPALTARLTETVLLPAGRDTFRPSDAPLMLKQAGRCRAAALGPGLSRRPEAVAFARRIYRRMPLPTVVDADGLAAVGGSPIGPRLLTPHEGEMASLLDEPFDRIRRDREAAARRAARRFKAIVVLKGHRSVITDGRRVRLNDSGNPGLATAGSGDVLTGILAALLGQGFSPWDAALLGTWLHGRAGDLAAAGIGPISLIASDIVESLPRAVREQTASFA